MSWGHIESKDLLDWTPASVSVALRPDQDYDIEGVFTGCWMPPQDTESTTLSVAYSSVKFLPFHWSTPPYPRDAAGISLATSIDGGQTWEKSSQNPILKGEPADVNVTGYRDPYVSSYPALDKARGQTEPGLYALVSGGIEGVGPTTFLYDIEKDNQEKWTYLNPLVDLPLRFQPSKKWNGNYGVNWECTNIIDLHAASGSDTRHFLIIGAEGDVEKEHIKNCDRPADAPKRTTRAQVWMSGDLVAADQGTKFQYSHGGYLDHGPYYAANSFLDPVTGRRIVYGWIPEEDITLDAAREKGWNGALALPRELSLLRIPRVTGALNSPLEDIAPFETKEEADGSVTVFTLGVKPIEELSRLRESSRVTNSETVLSLPGPEQEADKRIFTATSNIWELEATISIKPGCEVVGFHLRHNEDLSVRTTVSFSVTTETIIVDRASSTTKAKVNTCPDAGPFTLLTTQEPGSSPELERLQLRIFSDGDILEVYANDRFALATMVYSDSYGEEVGGITAFAQGGEASAVFENATLWDGLAPRLIQN